MKTKSCTFKACNRKHYAKGYCRKHYRQRIGESATRWQVIKSDPVLYEHWRELQRKWSRNHKRDHRKHSDKIYFGGNREIAIQRDNEKCVRCGMTREEHLAKWKKDLHVNHKDHTKRNDLDNLETLCLPCHASKSHYSKR